MSRSQSFPVVPGNHWEQSFPFPPLGERNYSTGIRSNKGVSLRGPLRPRDWVQK